MNYKFKRILVVIRRFMIDRFDLQTNESRKLTVIEEIKKGVEFKGLNLWVLIFAIFVASLGLNVNSTAVIIGAMLISPLMGPIMGIGLGVGIQDFELIKKSYKNLAIATIISILTSAIYFYISPLSDASSELLARTYPTTYDVLIAFFGGMAGIVAIGSGEKGNVVPGVAIATALMPPLCTAGYALATLQFSFFFGAFYLYFINGVFISFSAYLGTRIFKLPKHELADAVKNEKFKRYVFIVVFLTLVPSVYMSYNIIRTSFFESSANDFISTELDFPNTQFINKTIDYKNNKIEVFLLGEIIPENKIALAKDNLKKYNLHDVNLIIRQGANNSDSLDIRNIKALVMADFYKNTEQRLLEKNEKIEFLQNELSKYTKIEAISNNIYSEAEVIFPNISNIFLYYALRPSTTNNSTIISSSDSSSSSNNNSSNFEAAKSDTLLIAAISFYKTPKNEEKNKITDWLKARTQNKNILVYTN